MSKQGCTALLAKPHLRSAMKHFGTSGCLNRTCLCHTGTMQASIFKSKLKQVMLGEDAKTSSLLEPEPIALIHWLVQEALTGHSSPDSSQCFPTQTPNIHADESKSNARTKLGSCNIFSEISPLRSKTEWGADMGNCTQYRPFLCLKVIQPRVNLTASPWPKWCRGGRTYTHMPIVPDGLERIRCPVLIEQFASQARGTSKKPYLTQFWSIRCAEWRWCRRSGCHGWLEGHRSGGSWIFRKNSGQETIPDWGKNPPPIPSPEYMRGKQECRGYVPRIAGRYNSVMVHQYLSQDRTRTSKTGGRGGRKQTSSDQFLQNPGCQICIIHLIAAKWVLKGILYQKIKVLFCPSSQGITKAHGAVQTRSVTFSTMHR